MALERRDFGRLAGGEGVSLWTLGKGELEVEVMDYGATLVALRLPPKGGAGEDILLGFSSLEGYLSQDSYFGSTVGRVSGRIGGAGFTFEGKECRLAANDGQATLHGGTRGFDRRIWEAEAYEEGGEPRLRLCLRSPDGEEGFPGQLDVILIYGLSGANELFMRQELSARTPTVANLTNHAYFNLGGEGRGDIKDHRISIRASRRLETGGDLVPTGRILPVSGSAYDLRVPGSLRGGIEALGGYDSYFILDREGEALEEALRLEEPRSSRRLVLSTTLPGLQFYTGNFLAGALGKGASRYGRHAGLCLETQGYPDAPNHPEFPSIRLDAGKIRRAETRLALSW